jgi:glutamyl-tRNA reductase
MSIVVVGLSHRTASVEVRDRVSVSEQNHGSVLERLHALETVVECSLISTCNRSEAYLVSDDPDAARTGVIELFGAISGIDAGTLCNYIFTRNDMDAVRHLLCVASGLDSMIMGEPQIAGQVKDAGARALEAGTSGAILNRLFRSAVEASKRARTETEIADGAVSVSFAAVALAKKILGNLVERTALVLGAGEMSELTARHLVDNGVGRLMVSSRTFTRARDLAKRVNGKALSWSDAMDGLHRADIVISSTSATVRILEKPQVARAMQLRRNNAMFLIDIAVPRDIDPEAGTLYNVFLYDIDDLQAVVGANMQKRQREAEKVQHIVGEEVREFASWLNSLDVVPAIVAMRQRFQELLDEELERARLSDFSERQQEKVAGLLRLYMNKLLHAPQVRLREAADSGEALNYVDALMRLFDLDATSPGVVKSSPEEAPVERVRTEC